MNRKQFLQTIGLGAVAGLLPSVALAESEIDLKDIQNSKHIGYYMGGSITSSLPEELPAAEAVALRNHLMEAAADHDYLIVVNYPADWVEQVAHYYGISMIGMTVVAAEGVPASEVMALRRHIDEKITNHEGFQLICVPGIGLALLRKIQDWYTEYEPMYVALNYEAEVRFYNDPQAPRD